MFFKNVHNAPSPEKLAALTTKIASTAANIAQAGIDAVAKRLEAEHEQVAEKLASYEATKAELEQLVEATSSTYRRREMEEAVAAERQKKKPNVEAALQSLTEVQKGRMEQLEKVQLDEASARASAERAQEKEAEIRKEQSIKRGIRLEYLISKAWGSS